MLFWSSLAFSMIQQMLAIWSLVPFLNPAWTSGSSRFMYHWSVAWRILSIILLAVRWVQLCGSLNILWHCSSLGLEWKLTFSSPEFSTQENHYWVFQICWYIECSTFIALSFRVWNSSTGIPSPPPALSIVMFPKAHLICILWCLALGEWSHYHGYLGHEDLFLYSSSVYSCHTFLISSASVMSIPILSKQAHINHVFH